MSAASQRCCRGCATVDCHNMQHGPTPLRTPNPIAQPTPPHLTHLLLWFSLAAGGGKPGMALLDGRWRLLYSSGFTSGSLGGRRPGPSFGSLPLTLGPVYQDVYTGGWDAGKGGWV